MASRKIAIFIDSIYNENMEYDIAIIGSGPAGISASLSAKLRGKNIILIGQKNLSEKLEKAHLIKNYPGFSEISGSELKNNFIKNLESLGIEIVEDKIAQIYALGKKFSIQGFNTYEAKKVILATGVDFSKKLKGEKESLGRSVSYCATCDGFFYKGKEIVIVTENEKSEATEKEENFLAGLAKNVINLKEDEIEEIKGAGISGSSGTKVLKKDGSEIEADGIFILRENVSSENLVPGLKTENNSVIVDRKMETNIKGLFACGDITGSPFQIAKAVGEGNVAALSAVESL